MTNVVPMSRPLRLALLADAAASGATAALLVRVNEQMGLILPVSTLMARRPTCGCTTFSSSRRSTVRLPKPTR